MGGGVHDGLREQLEEEVLAVGGPRGVEDVDQRPQAVGVVGEADGGHRPAPGAWRTGVGAGGSSSKREGELPPIIPTRIKYLNFENN